MARIKKTKRSTAPSKKIQLQEIMSCGSDAKYFINNYVQISHPMKGMVKFDTFPFQDNCLDVFQDNRFVIVNKSRQLGLSTISAAFCLWMAIFQKQKNIGVIATQLKTAQLFIRKVKDMLGSLPKWMIMPEIVGDSKSHLEFSNGSRIEASATSQNAFRGSALSMLIVDEAAHVEGIEELWLALYPTLSTGGSAILISTPAGVGNFFLRVWKKAKVGESDFVPLELMWTVHPERDQTWFEEQKKAIVEAKGERGVAMELLCSFASSGDTFLRAEVMDNIFKRIKKPIAFWGPEWTVKKDMWIWVHPVSEHKYIISADISRGDAEDFSAFHVIDTDSDEVVAEYKGKIPPDKFGEMLAVVGLRYNVAMICPERNSVGLPACLKLKEMNYPNLYYHKMHKNVYMVYSTMEMKNEIPGFETTQKSKTEILAKLEDVLRNKRIAVYSERLYAELQTYIWKKNNKLSAQKGYNDDLIMALAIGNSLFDAGGAAVYDSDEIAKAMLAGMSVSTKIFSATDNPQGEQNAGSPIMTDGSLSDFLEKNRSMASHANSGTHDYNSPFWSQFSWMFKN